MHRLIASSLGIGLILGKLRDSDAGSGTLGALAAVPLWLAVRTAGVGAEVLVVVLLVGAGLWAAAPFATDGRDPGWIVIDETAGASLAMVGLGGWAAVVGWLVARALDIWKFAPGVPQAERLSGSGGIMADDLVAGAYGLAAGWIVAGVL